MTTAEITSEVMRVLADKRYLCSDEAELQRLVAVALDEAGVRYKREKRLSVRDRVDFMIFGGVVLELKVQTSEKSVLRQALRYAEHGEVTAVIVAGTCHSVLRLPASAHGKPVHAIQLKSW